jgi:hypothetical protein
VLYGRPVVFLSCSEKFKLTVARLIRDGLREAGVQGVIVSDELALPRTGWTPEDKVESYLDASDAFLALCTADNELTDGTVECRQNIISEIERARKKPHLRDKIMIFKAASVRLPSNINPTYEHLDPGNIDTSIDLIARQLQIWGVIAARASAPPATKSTIDVDNLISSVNLGEHDKASQLAYKIALETKRADQAKAVTDLLSRLRSGTGGPHTVGHVLEGLARVDHSLVPPEAIEELSLSPITEHRIVAIFLLWDLAEVSPGQVPLGILGRLARPADEDWYVQAPAMAITKLLMLHRKNARLILDRLARSSEPQDRHEVAHALADLATVDASAIPPDLAKRLSKDSDTLVASKAREVLDALKALPDDAYAKRFGPFGI